MCGLAYATPGDLQAESSRMDTARDAVSAIHVEVAQLRHEHELTVTKLQSELDASRARSDAMKARLQELESTRHSLEDRSSMPPQETLSRLSGETVSDYLSLGVRRNSQLNTGHVFFMYDDGRKASGF